MTSNTRRPSLGAALGIVAVVIAMSGVSFAAGVKITSSKQIKNGIVTSADIKNHTITANDVKSLRWRVVGTAGQPTFEAPWANFSSDYASASFRKGPDGRVYLRGAVTAGVNQVSGDTIFTLPAGFRPARCANFSVGSFDGGGGQSLGSIEVCPDGGVTTYAATDDRFVSLEGVAFSLN